LANWQRHQSWLENARWAILNRLEGSGQYGLDDPMQDELGELSLYDNHPADIASELFERAKDVGLRHMDKLQLQEIDRALQAIADGT
jgi:DnaK suppressor protein